MYVIGDVHGCFRTLKALVNKLPKDAKICFVGDLIDRGSNIKEVVEFVKFNGYDCILGNHEEFMIETMEILFENPEYYYQSEWVNSLGGDATLKSYGSLETLRDNKILHEHLEWFKSLPLYKEYKDLKTNDGRYLVVSHAAANDKWQYKNYDKKSSEYLMFYNEIMRQRRIGIHDNKDIFNIFGHTPQDIPDVKEFYAAVDLGCIYGNTLCAIEFPSLKTIVQECLE